MTDVAPHNFISNTGPVLLITTDPTITESVKDLVALHNGTLWDHTQTTLPSPARWDEASVVLVGDDASGTVAPRFDRRDRVVLVALDMDDAGVWRRAVDLGAEHVAHLPDATAWLNDKIAQASQQADPYCRWCQLPRSNALHNPAAQAAAEHNEAVRVRDEAQKRVKETAIVYLRVQSQKDNPDARYLSFTYTNEYFGHGQTGAVVTAGYLFDEDFKQLPMFEDGNPDPLWDEYDDGGFLYSVVTGEVETSDGDVYVLRLSDGAVLENIDLHEHEDDEDVPTHDPLAP